MVDWSYVAGFLDGDGGYFVPKTTLKQQKLYRFTLYNTNLECLLEIQWFLEEQRVVSTIQRYIGKTAGRPQYLLRVNRQRDVLIIANQIKDRVIIKRDRILESIQTIPMMILRHPFQNGNVSNKADCLWKSGLSIPKIAKELDCTYGQTRWYLNKNMGYVDYG
jgi:hypothetical protein